MAKPKKTILIHPHTGEEHPFDPGHAQRIMALPNNGGWTYKEKKTKENAGKRRTTKAAATEAQAQEDDCGCS